MGLRILILCEGDAETHHSWSGISKSVVDHLRLAGHTVITGDVDLYGLPRLLGLLATWAPHRHRWWVRYHLTRVPHELRSRRAARIVRRHASKVDLILQFGATFEPRSRGSLPFAIYCDGNARLAERGETGGQAEVGALTRAELDALIARESRIYAQALRIFTFSRRLTESFVEDFGVPPHRVMTVGAGPNLDAATIPYPRQPRPPEAPPTILFVGRQFERKGGDLLLKAFARVRNELPDARLLIVGPPDLRVDQPGVTALGFLRKDVPEQELRLREAYTEADVFCLPTRFEPFGVVFLEAMLYGLPCIGPNAWAVPEMLVDGETGIIVPPEDVDALTEGLLQVLRDPEKARRMGEAGRERAVSRFLWSSIVKSIAGELEAALQRRSD